MVECIIRGGQLIDGTGSPPRRADIGIDGGRIATIGDLAGERADVVIDAEGLVVAPGVIDIHTHYDAQLFWDPYATPSPLHGVTTVVGGNCGFSLAPLAAENADYLSRMLARVEGMPLETLQQAVPWNWSTFADYLHALEGNVGVNVGFMVGHTALRRHVMGPESHREATPDEIEEMAALLHASLDAGGLGFSSSVSVTHNDAEGQPVPSRFASRREFLRLCEVAGEHEGTQLEIVPNPGLFDDATIDLFASMSATANRPLNWNLLGVSSRTKPETENKLAASDAAAAKGGRVVALTMPMLPTLRVNFVSGFVLDSLPGWASLFEMPLAERREKLLLPEYRRELAASAATTDSGGLRLLTKWGRLVIVQTFDPANEGLAGRSVGDIATERGQEPFDCLLDIVCTDDLRTVFGTVAIGDDQESWELRRQVWADPRTLIGGSDAGAHLDMIDTFGLASFVLGPLVRDRNLLPLETAVHYLTAAPADLYGVVDRGRVVQGAWADLMVFDPARIAPDPIEMRYDLPADAPRLYAASQGIEHVLVNGVEIVRHGELTDARPGQVLRSGHDTRTVKAS
jgi:N-acyl-D-aspartate/D-glutamate deacylase